MRRPWLSLLAWLVGVVCLFAWYVPLWPSQPQPLPDSGWALGLSVACERGMAFGTELVFTYGPYGCLSTRQYWPATYLASIVGYALVAAVSIGLMSTSAQDMRARAASFAALFWLGLTPDTALLALPLSYAVHGVRVRRHTLWSGLAVVLFGPLALVKFTLLPLVLGAIVAAALWRPRAIVAAATDLGVFAVALAIAWVAAHQPIGGLADYLLNAGEMARGYPQAMNWPAGWGGTGIIAFALAIVVMLIALVTMGLTFVQLRDIDDRSWVRVAWVLILLGGVLLLIRHGITRADPGHLLIPVVYAGAYGLALHTNTERHARKLLVAIVACAVLTTAFAEGRYQGKGGGFFFGHLQSTLEGVARLAQGDNLRTALDQELSRARSILESERAPLSAIQGRYDVLGNDQYLILALGSSQWTPRPVLQGYSAYTELLARLDADFIASDRAPPWLVMQVQTIDGRLPMMDDAALWPVLARHYTVAEHAGTRLVLRRGSPAAPDAMSPQSVQIQGADWMPLPAFNAPTLYASIAIEPRILDRIRSIAWRPPIHFLELRRAGSREVQRFRMVPEAAASGFVLSPLILTTTQFALWLQHTAQPEQAVTDLRVVDERGATLPVSVTIRTTPFYLP